MQITRSMGIPHSRYAIVINKRGITTERQNAKVGGGWYSKAGVTFPWPWIKVS